MEKNWKEKEMGDREKERKRAGGTMSILTRGKGRKEEPDML